MFALGEPDLALEARRDILNLRAGTQIPGYTGHRPGVKHGFGNTYGHQTRLSYIRQFESKEEENVPNESSNDMSLEILVEDEISRNMFVDSRSRFLIPDPKNDSSAVGELLRGGPMPYADHYRLHRRPRLPPPPSQDQTQSYDQQFQHRNGINGAPISLSRRPNVDSSDRKNSGGGNDNHHWSSTPSKPIPIADEQRVREKLRLYKMMRERRERNEQIASDIRRSRPVSNSDLVHHYCSN